MNNPKLLRALVALSALITALLGAASYADLLPKEYAAFTGLITAALLGAKEIVVIIGDIADDGVRNNSFKPDAATVKQWTGVIIACLFCLFMVSCENLTKEEAQAAAKDIAIEIGLGAGQVTVDVARARLLQAEAAFHEATITPGVGVKNILAKQLAYEAAKRALDAAEKALAKEKAKRVPAKQPVDVQPQAAVQDSKFKVPSFNVRNTSVCSEGLDRDTDRAAKRFANCQDFLPGEISGAHAHSQARAASRRGTAQRFSHRFREAHRLA